MRKKSRQMPADWALSVFDRAPYITVSMTDKEGNPYGLPLSLVRTDDETFYFHGAMEGKKLDVLSNNPNVCLSAVSKCHPIVGPKDGSFTLEFESALAYGTASIVTDDSEKIQALRVICERFLPHHMEAFDASIARSLAHTCIVRIRLTEPPIGKRKQFGPDGNEIKNIDK